MMGGSAEHEHRRAHRLLSCALTLAVFVIAWGVLELGHAPAPLHADTHEDLLRARSCVEAGVCDTAGASTRVPGITQGVLWVSCLALLRGAGVSIATIHSLAMALAAMGSALLFLFLRRRSKETAVIVAALTCLATLYGGALAILWNPTLTPLPAALVLIVALCHVDAGRGWTAVPLGLALGLLLETHPVSVLLMPGALLIAGLPLRRWVDASLAPLLAGGIALSLYLGISPQAVIENLTFAWSRFAPWFFGATCLLLLSSVYLRSRFRKLPLRRRRGVAALLLAGPPLVVVLGAWLFGDDARFPSRYLAPAFPALAYLAAHLVVPQLRSRKSRAASMIALAALALAELFFMRDSHLNEPEVTLVSVESLGDHFASNGTGLDDVSARLSGPHCREILPGLAALGLPLTGPDAGALPSEDLVVVPESRLRALGGRLGDLARGRWRAIASPTGTLLLGSLDPWLDRRRFRACAFTGDSEEAPSLCTEGELRPGVRSLVAANTSLAWSRLDELNLAWLERDERFVRATRIVYELEVEIPPGDERRELRIAPSRRYGCQSTRFIAAHDLQPDGVLPSQSLFLQGSSQWQRGTVELEVRLGACGANALPLFPPCVSEVADSDSVVQRQLLFEAGG